MEKLKSIGFDFRYFTHYHQSRKGRVFKVCYDYAYLNLESNQILLINSNERKYSKFKFLNNSLHTEAQKNMDLETVKEIQENIA